MASMNSVQPPAPSVGSVVRAGAIAGIVAGFLCALMYGVGRVFGTDFQVTVGGSDQLRDVSFLGVFVAPIVVGALSAYVAALLFRRPSGFLFVLLFGFAFTVLSLFVPLIQPSDVTWPTRLWLVAMHLVTGVIVVPVVAFAVAARSFRMSSFGQPTSFVVIDGVVVEETRPSGQVIQGEVIESSDDVDGRPPA